MTKHLCNVRRGGSLQLVPFVPHGCGKVQKSEYSVQICMENGKKVWSSSKASRPQEAEALFGLVVIAHKWKT